MKIMKPCLAKLDCIVIVTFRCEQSDDVARMVSPLAGYGVAA